MRTAVIIVSSGRPEILRDTVEDVLTQTAPPQGIFLSTIKPDDWQGRAGDDPRIRHLHGRKGIPVQLNAAIDALDAGTEIVFIFDDDVALAPDYCERALRWFAEEPGLLAFDGVHLRDGDVLRGEADEVLAAQLGARPHTRIDRDKIYGCNMCVRREVLRLERFDEKLEGYAWLFEFDWIRRVRRHGKTGRVHDCHLVHLMAPSGRGPGFKMGYMQVAHPIYVYRKGGMPVGELLRNFLWKQCLKNLLKSVTGDPKIDRQGRLKGNLSAVADLLLGRLQPKPAKE